MKIDIRPRQSGKTTEAFRKSISTGYTVVTSQTLVDSYNKYKLKAWGFSEEEVAKIPQPITYKEYLDPALLDGRIIKGFIIDDLNKFLRECQPYYPVEYLYTSLDELGENKTRITIG